MRFGVVIPVGADAERSGGPAGAAADAEQAGLDLVWLESEPATELTPADALTAAAFVAPATSFIRLAALAAIGPHPVHIAEQAAVADNACGGRLVLALSDAGNPEAPLRETAEVVLAATGPRPFRHDGERWRIPGRLVGNQSEERISVTPKPAQLRLPVWLAGAGAARAGSQLGLSHISGPADSPQDAAAGWRLSEAALGAAAASLLRPAVRELSCAATGDFDDERLTQSLRAESDDWGLELAILRLPPGLDRGARRRAVGRLAALVAPPLRMDRVPERVLDYWRRELVLRWDPRAAGAE